MHITPFQTPTSNFAGEPALVADRIKIVEATIRVLQRLDYHAATQIDVAAELGVDVDAVTRHFPSWDGLVIATMERWMSGRQAATWDVALTHGAVPFLRELLTVNINEPALSRLQLAILSAASSPDYAGHPYIRHQYLTLLGYVQHALTEDIRAGREPASMEPVHGAEQLLAIYQGFQLQAMMRDFDALDAFDRATARLRRSWPDNDTTPDPAWIL